MNAQFENTNYVISTVLDHITADVKKFVLLVIENLSYLILIN